MKLLPLQFVHHGVASSHLCPGSFIRTSNKPTVCRISVMRRLTTGIRFEKCVVRRFRRCANVLECTYTNLDSIAYYTPRLYGIAYCS